MEYEISEKDSNQRIDKFVKRLLKDAPLSFIYKMFRQKDVKVNGKKANIDYILQPGDHVYIYLKEDLMKQFRSSTQVKPVTPDFKILYEDDNIIACDKPKGLLVHGDKNEKRITLQNMVVSYLSQKGEFDPDNDTGFIPSPAHRLDRNTSGIVLFGKNLRSVNELELMFKERDQIEKTYLLLVDGILPKEGRIDVPLKKDEKKMTVTPTPLSRGGKEAHTVYKRISVLDSSFSLAEAELLTGRTHQLRVHFAYIGHPIIGDAKYGDFEVNKMFEKAYGYRNQFLHASKFVFKEGIEGYLSYLSGLVIESPLPSKEQKIIDTLRGAK